ncbi:MAG TPA: AGE family epimerase/isomerase, partial [Sedimentisphaerales bacterium]|nr:AGE family epimerase/isomerase [Sedimentisphaerales bacterium]
NEAIHKRKLLEDIDILIKRMMHPEFKTGIPQFTVDWKVAPQIKFDIVWGWDRYSESGQKENANDNTCYGHNIEFAWLFIHALEVMGTPMDKYKPMLKTIIEHTVNNGIDKKFGGVFVEGPHAGGVYDMEKEFWQQAESLIGLLDACLYFDADKYWPYYQNVHKFVFEKGINHKVGEWWPLLTREGEPIWTHMSHNWKVNYHSVRAMVKSIQRLEKLLQKYGN